MKDCEICEMLASTEEVRLFASAHWVLFLSYEQSYLGRALICWRAGRWDAQWAPGSYRPDRHPGSMAELHGSEMSEFLWVASQYEEVVKRDFGATLINYEFLMNHAFRQEPYNPHAHWHLRPRYKEPVEMFGRVFSDPTFGEPIDRSRKMKVDRETQRRSPLRWASFLRRWRNLLGPDGNLAVRAYSMVKII